MFFKNIFKLFRNKNTLSNKIEWEEDYINRYFYYFDREIQRMRLLVPIDSNDKMDKIEDLGSKLDEKINWFDDIRKSDSKLYVDRSTNIKLEHLSKHFNRTLDYIISFSPDKLTKDKMNKMKVKKYVI